MSNPKEKNQSSFELVRKFHDKFDLPTDRSPQNISKDEYEFRLGFMKEELEEYQEAYEQGDLEGMFDALVDLKYVVDGTALFHGFPMDKGTEEVQRANMAKQRARSEEASKRNSDLDVVKPEGWEPPKMQEILDIELNE